MSRQKFTSSLLVLALAGATVLAGCTGQQQVSRPPSPAAQRTAEPAPVRTGGWPTMRSNNATNWVSMAYPTGTASTSAIGIEKGMPREVRLNQPFEYDLIVTNLTNGELTGVVVTDQAQNGLRITGSSPQGQGGAGGTHTWNLGTLGPKAPKRIRVNSVASTEGSVGSCASVTYSSLLCAAVPVVSPKLRLVKTGPAEVLKCDDITYNFEVSNTGTGTLRGVKINDPLPAGLSAPGGGRTLIYGPVDLVAGASRKFSGKVRAHRTGRFSNQATATSAGGITAQSGQVATVVRAPVLKIAKTCPTKQFVGRPLRYEITVTNSGDGVANDTVIEDQVPSNTQFVSASDNGRFAGRRVRWIIGTLRPGTSKKVTMVLNPVTSGTYRNTATARAYCADPVSDSCESLVTGIPAVLLEVIDLEDPDEVGTTETYLITVTNQGSAPGTNIRIVCTLEPNQEYVSSSGPTRGAGRGSTVTFEPLASLAAKQKATWRVVVRNVKAGDVRFKVALNSDQLTRPVEESEATNVYE